MLMTNEYRSAYKRVHTAEQEAELRASGWVVVEEPKEEKQEPKQEEKEEEVKAPRIVKGGKNALMYKGKYLSQWVTIATKKELIAIFDYYGIPYAVKTSASDMRGRLREYIRQVKAEDKKNDGQ